MPTAHHSRVTMTAYSGTGNALTAARWFAERAEAAGAQADVTLMDHQTGPPSFGNDDGRILLGFLYSTHGFCVPWTMLKLMARVPRRAGRPADVFLLNTRGGLKAGPLLLPGLSGIALLLPWLWFMVLGYRVVGMRPLDMPSSWHQLHPALSDASVRAILARRHQQVDALADALLSGRTHRRGWFTLPIDLALIPVTFGYLTVGRFGLAKLQVASTDCDGCQLCVKMCPTQAIEMRAGRPHWTLRCEACMRCYSICPHRSVQTCLLYALILLAPWFGLVDWVHAQVWPHVVALPTAAAAPAMLLYLLGWIAVTLLFTVGCYAVLSWMMRISWLNRAINFASVTRFFRRYLAPGVKAKHLRPKGDQGIR